MKAIAMFAVTVVLVAASAGQAQENKDRSSFSDPVIYRNANIPAALRAFEGCLSIENEGVQESAMAQLAMLKLMVPTVNDETVVRRLEELSLSAPAPSTRFKAYITSQVYRSPEYFAGEQGMRYKAGDDLFNALAARLQESLLSYKGE
jgi:hypothetical protein